MYAYWLDYIVFYHLLLYRTELYWYVVTADIRAVGFLLRVRNAIVTK